MTSESAGQSTDDATPVIVRSHAVGDIAVPPTSIMHFAEPLWGFPERLDYVLLPAARQGLYWLQSVDDETTVFLLADPFILQAGFAIDLSDADREAIGVTSPDQVFALVMLTLPMAEGAGVTGNFRAPLVFHLERRLALQFVTSDERYSLREPVDLAVFPPQASGVKLL